MENSIKLHDRFFALYKSEEEIYKCIAAMAQQIYNDLNGEIPYFIGVLNGSFMFVSELAKRYPGPCEVHFVKLASYQGTETTGKVHTLIGVPPYLRVKKVIVLEDIVDTGHTLEALVKLLQEEGVTEVKIATLFFKPQAYQKNTQLDYVGMEIENRFVVGFGLDYDQLGRNIPALYQVKES